MPSKVYFSAAADADLESIATYTRERFGEAQELKYHKSLAAAFSLIGSFPQIGRDTSDVKPGSRCHVHSSHAIYYRLKDKDIVILRILGPGQNPLSEFQD